MEDISNTSIDFGSLTLDDNNNHHKRTSSTIDIPLPSIMTMLNDNSNENRCSTADTVSTAGESSSWGGESSAWGTSSCEYSCLEDELLSIDAAHQAAIDNDDDDESECSLTLDDIRIFFLEDQVDPRRSPPPLARTDFKGDSQTSFTLDDLAEVDDDSERNSSEHRLRRRRRRSSLYQPSDPCGSGGNQQAKPLKGILKNGSSKSIAPMKASATDGKSRRSSSLAMLLMDDSNFLDLSNGSLEGFDFDDNGSGNDDDEASINLMQGNGWSLLQQSFSDNNNDNNQSLNDWKSEYFDDDSDLQKMVSFSSVRVHYHACVVGDNPSVTEGAPLALAWKAVESQTYASLDAYEEDEHQQKQKNRHSNNTDKAKRTRQSASPQQRCMAINNNNTQMARTAPRRLDSEERMFLLLASGVSLQDIQQAEHRANRDREEREATKQQHMLLGNGCGVLPKTSGALLRAVPKNIMKDDDVCCATITDGDDGDAAAVALGRASE